MNNLNSKGKHLSYLLRHDMQAFEDNKIDENGWRSIEELCTLGFSKEEIDDIVKTNNKNRYEYNEDKSKIRARQGHSIPVDVELKETDPPNSLYHGTATRFVDSIMREGIKSQSRLYVHLSSDVETAINVGKRHGIPIVLRVDTYRMKKDGIKFFLSNNGVWLTKFVDKKYLEKL